MLKDFVVYVGLTLLVLHEMDAVKRKEWRMFVILNPSKDETAYIIFSILHLPLFIILLWGIFNSSEKTALIFTYSLNVFYIIHLLLHLLFIKNKNNEFKSVYSWFIIIGLAICGTVSLFMVVL